MMREFLRRLRDDEQGVSAMIVAIMAVALLGAAGLAIDISRFTYQRELTRDALEAGAQSGAYYLPSNPTAAISAAIAATKYVDANATPDVTPYCIVPAVGASYDSTTVGAFCRPGAADSKGYYPISSFPGTKCSSTSGICAIPCTTIAGSPPTVAAGYTCNALAVSDSSTVNYLFGRAMGLISQTFGGASQVVAACKGASCGKTSPVPMNVVVMIDRSSSMSPYKALLSTGVQNMLKIMTPAEHFVAFGAMGPSSGNASCAANAGNKMDAAGSAWVAADFTDTYTVSGALNSNNGVVKALNCFPTSSTGSFLAAGLKGAARYLLGYDSSTVNSLRSRTGTLTKAIIFESDGQPSENSSNVSNTTANPSVTASGITSLTASASRPWNSTAANNCANFQKVATLAKAQGILIVTVGFNLTSSSTCGSGLASDALAAVASPRPNGVASAADYDCTTTAGVASENADGDHFFCSSSSAADLSSVFGSAFSQLLKNSRFIRLP